MKPYFKNYDYKLILISVVILTCSYLSLMYIDLLKSTVRNLLESKWLNPSVWIFTIYPFLLNYYIHKSKHLKSNRIVTQVFGEFIDNALGGFGHGTIITTALTLLKGLYIQTYFTDKQYFLEFDKLDMLTLFGIVGFLLFFSIKKVVGVFNEVHKIKNTEIVQPVD